MQRSRLALAAVTIVALAAAVPVAGSIDFTAEQFEHVTGNRDLALFHSLLQLAQDKRKNRRRLYRVRGQAARL